MRASMPLAYTSVPAASSHCVEDLHLLSKANSSIERCGQRTCFAAGYVPDIVYCNPKEISLLAGISLECLISTDVTKLAASMALGLQDMTICSATNTVAVQVQVCSSRIETDERNL